MANEITIYRGDTATITATIKDGDGDVVDLTGYTAKLTVKSSDSDTDANAVIGPITATISAPTTGVAVFSLSATNTAVTAGKYAYDVQINDGTTDVKTVIKSSFTVVQDVTKA